MKVKLKKGEKLSSNNNYCNLPYNKWVMLNQGKSVELEVLPKQLDDKIENLNFQKRR
ncbi:MAG: hypothetical protein CM15mV137_200 [uncultured marine virus]|nr:MAG: hypothetical protein CM15mV137_200 [uncultured marine virus]